MAASTAAAEAPDAEPTDQDPAELFDAIETGNVDAVVKWIAAGGEVNLRDSIGDSPILIATENEQSYIIKLLVDAGADINEKAGASNETPLILAAYYGDANFVAFLVEECGANLEVKSARGDTALNVASEWGNVDTVKYLLEAGADPNVVNRNGKKAGDEFEMVFVEEIDSDEIKVALTAARVARRTAQQQNAK